MYSVVLLAALVSGENTPDCFFGRGCGCSGYSWGTCYGGCYGSCYGGHGCHGGYGCGGCGGCGGCYGCGGCGGCYGCGGCGGWGTAYSGYAPGWSCYGGCGGYSSPAYGQPMPVVSGMPESVKSGGKVITTKDEEQVSAPSRAKLIVDMPEDAKLYVDDKPVSVWGKKSFRTPVLEKGQEYYYEVRAEIIRDGKPISETRRVIVKAGATIRADFSTLGEATGIASAKNR